MAARAPPQSLVASSRSQSPCGKLVRANTVSQSAIQAPVAAISVGIVKGVPLLDLCYEEDSTAEVDFNVVMTGDDAFVEVQGTAEGKPFSRAGHGRTDGSSRAPGVRQLFAVSAGGAGGRSAHVVAEECPADDV